MPETSYISREQDSQAAFFINELDQSIDFPSETHFSTVYTAQSDQDKIVNFVDVAPPYNPDSHPSSHESTSNTFSSLSLPGPENELNGPLRATTSKSKKRERSPPPAYSVTSTIEREHPTKRLKTTSSRSGSRASTSSSTSTATLNSLEIVNTPSPSTRKTVVAAAGTANNDILKRSLTSSTSHDSQVQVPKSLDLHHSLFDSVVNIPDIIIQSPSPALSSSSSSSSSANDTSTTYQVPDSNFDHISTSETLPKPFTFSASSINIPHSHPCHHPLLSHPNPAAIIAAAADNATSALKPLASQYITQLTPTSSQARQAPPVINDDDIFKECIDSLFRQAHNSESLQSINPQRLIQKTETSTNAYPHHVQSQSQYQGQSQSAFPLNANGMLNPYYLSLLVPTQTRPQPQPQPQSQTQLLSLSPSSYYYYDNNPYQLNSYSQAVGPGDPTSNYIYDLNNSIINNSYNDNNDFGSMSLIRTEPTNNLQTPLTVPTTKTAQTLINSQIEEEIRQIKETNVLFFKKLDVLEAGGPIPSLMLKLMKDLVASNPELIETRKQEKGKGKAVELS